MNIFEAMQKTVDEAVSSGSMAYLYMRSAGYFVSQEYWNDWLFKAYPGGRKIMSAKCNAIVNKVILARNEK